MGRRFRSVPIWRAMQASEQKSRRFRHDQSFDVTQLMFGEPAILRKRSWIEPELVSFPIAFHANVRWPWASDRLCYSMPGEHVDFRDHILRDSAAPNHAAWENNPNLLLNMALCRTIDTLPHAAGPFPNEKRDFPNANRERPFANRERTNSVREIPIVERVLTDATGDSPFELSDDAKLARSKLKNTKVTLVASPAPCHRQKVESHQLISPVAAAGTG